MKVSIYKDEWYPVYEICPDEDGYGIPCQVPDELISKWKSVNEDFAKVQEALRALYRATQDEQRTAK